MNLENTHYNAFISYRHTEPDMFVAKTLHKRLESFKIPSDILKKHPELPKKIERVFRDQEELPLSSNLADPITEALKNSDNLIVICTPRLPESRWCLKEIDTFISLHGREHVFAVLAEGEPSESFPPQLLVNENGEPMEPLAADFRGKDNNEINKKMKTEILRLIAPMFGLNFDDLRQRHKEQRQKRIIAIGGVILAVALGFATYCGITALKISNQAKEIQAQNDQIMAQNDEIKAQSDVIEEQYREAELKYENSVANIASNMMGDGIVNETIYALRSAMPATMDDNDKPYSEDAQRALSKALGLYNCARFMPVDTFDTGSKILGMWMSPSANVLAALNDANTLYVWDVETHETLFEIYVGRVNNYKSCVEFVTDDCLVAYDENGEFLLDIKSKEKTYLSNTYTDVYVNEKTGKAVVFDGAKFMIIDGATKKVSEGAVVQDDDMMVVAFTATISDDGILAVCYSNLMEEIRHIGCYDINDGSELMQIELPDEYSVTEVAINDGNLYVSGAYPTHETILSYKGYFRKIDMSSQKTLWNKDTDVALSDIRVCEIDGIKYVFGCRYDGMYTMDDEVGEIIFSGSTNDNIVSVYDLNSANSVLTIDGGGRLIPYSINTGIAIDSSAYAYAIEGRVNHACFKKGVLFFNTGDNGYVTRYASTVLDSTKAVGKCNTSEVVSTNGRFSIQSDYRGNGDYCYTVKDVRTQETIGSFDAKSGLYFFLDNGNKLVTYNHSIEVYDLATATRIDEKSFDSDLGSVKHSDTNSHYMYYTDIEDGTETIHAVTIEDGAATDMIIKDFNKGVFDMYLSFAPDGSECVFLDKVTNKLNIYESGNGEAVKSVDIGGGANAVMYSSDGKYICVGYNTSVVKFYNSGSGTLVATIYNCVNELDEVTKIPYQDGYLILGYLGVGKVINSEMKPIAEFNDCVGYCEESDVLIFESNGTVYECPLVTYEEIIELADERLEGITPSAEILSKYSIEGE